MRLTYIASVDADNGIKCMHGPTECLGDMLALCAADLHPNSTIRSLGFSTCLVMNYTRIPARELVESCANEHGVGFDDLNSCISEEGKGLDLLEESVIRSADAGVKKSCTVRVNDEIWCIRDGAKWKDCPQGSKPMDLVSQVERLYKKAKSLGSGHV